MPNKPKKETLIPLLNPPPLRGGGRWGFTLIEVLIYTAILSISGSLLSGVLFNTTKIKSRQTAVIEVNEQLSFVLQNIQRSIMDSSIIDIDAGTSTSTLILKFKNDAKNPTKFYISDSKVYKKEAANTAQPLTDSSVIADAINFLKISGYSGHDSVQIDLTLSYNTSNPTSAFSRTLSSAIARVSAATFDSNLIPGTTSFYDIGTTALPWNNVYINGSVGIGNTAPLSKLGVTGSASVGATYGIIAAPTSGMIIEGNVGIGTTNPVANLQVHVASGNVNEYISTDDVAGRPALWLLNNYAAIANYQGVGAVGTNLRLVSNASGTLGGVDGITVQTGGNVGIGTTTPNTTLDITSPDATATKSLGMSSQRGGYGSFPVYNAGGSKNYLNGYYVWMAPNKYERFFDIAAFGAPDGTNGGSFIRFLTNPVTLGTDAIERMRITDIGNVGIGTTNPQTPLDVVGNFQASGASSQFTGGALAIDGLNAGVKTLYIRDYTNANNWNYIRSESGKFSINAVANNDIYLAPGGTGRTIINNGNVGIGTTGPENSLSVAGTFGTSPTVQGVHMGVQTGYGAIQSYGSTGTLIDFSGTSGRDYDFREIFTASANTLTLTASTTANMLVLNGNGNVGIGTADPGTHKLSVVGTAGLSTGTAWTSTSDQRWKNVYSELKGESLNKIMALRPVSYRWNALHDSQFGANPGLKYGFIAQEVKNVIPEMISQDAKGYYWYNPSGMEAILTGAIQDQQKQIEELKAEISELKLHLVK